MASKAGYQAIPDVENPPAAASAALDPKELYPGANDKQADFLGMLDKCIDGPSIKIGLNEVTKDDVKKASWSICLSLTVLIILGLVLFTGSVVLGNAHLHLDPLEVEVFPYVAAGIMFLVTFLIVDGRIMTYARILIDAIEDAKEKIGGNIDGVGKDVNRQVDDVEAKLDEIIGPLKSHLRRVKNSASLLKQVDPDISFPDVNGLQGDLNGATDKVTAKCNEVKRALDVDQLLPSYVRSPCSFRLRYVFPLLLFFVAVQMASAYGFTVWYPMLFRVPIKTTKKVTTTTKTTEAVEEKTDDSKMLRSLIAEYSTKTDGTNKMLRGLVTTDETKTDETKTAEKTVPPKTSEGAFTKILNETAMFFEDDIGDYVEDSWWFALSMAQACVIALIQVILVLCCTGRGPTVAAINQFYDEISVYAMSVARAQGLTDVCEDVLGTRMSRIKTKFLVVVEKQAKVDETMAQLVKAGGVVEEVAAVLPDVAAQVPVGLRKESSRFGRFFGMS